MNYRPIFIAGCDRSGTTLLGDMLGNSQWTVTTPESQFLHDLVIQLQLNSFRTPEEAAAWLLDHFRFVAWNLPLTLTELADHMDLNNPRATVEWLLGKYAKHVHPNKQYADVWIDHTPDNFKYQPLLKNLFPEARFIHIVRDGRAVCASVKKLNWGPNNAYAASRHWADRLLEAMTVEVAEGNNCLRVRFEDLLENPAVVLSQVCEFVGVPFDSAMLQGGGLVVPEFTRNQHSLIGKPPQPGRAGGWRKQLSGAELRDFESFPLSHILLTRLGYQPLFKEPPHRSTLRVLGCYFHNFGHYLINRFQHRRMERRAVASYRQQSLQPHDQGSSSRTEVPAIAMPEALNTSHQG